MSNFIIDSSKDINIGNQSNRVNISNVNVSSAYIETINSTTGNIGTINSTTGTIGTINSTTGTIGTINSTTGNIGNVVSTTGTIGTINSTTGNITNIYSTTLGLTTYNTHVATTQYVKNALDNLDINPTYINASTVNVSVNANISLLNASIANISLINSNSRINTSNLIASIANISLLSGYYFNTINGLSTQGFITGDRVISRTINATEFINVSKLVCTFDSQAPTIAQNLAGDNRIATTAFVKTAISNINIGGIPQYIENLNASNANMSLVNTSTIKCITGNFAILFTNQVVVAGSYINAPTANIKTINASTINVSVINSSTANVSLINTSIINSSVINSSIGYINNLYTTLPLVSINTSQVATTEYVKYVIDNLNLNQSVLNASTANVSVINSSTANISVINSSIAFIKNISSLNASIQIIHVTTLNTPNANIETINASTANIQTINTSTINSSDINSTRSNISSINSSIINVQNISSLNASIQIIHVTNGNISVINSSIAIIKNISSSTINASTINVSTINVTTFYIPTIDASTILASTANIQTIISSNASIQIINALSATIENSVTARGINSSGINSGIAIFDTMTAGGAYANTMDVNLLIRSLYADLKYINASTANIETINISTLIVPIINASTSNISVMNASTSNISTINATNLNATNLNATDLQVNKGGFFYINASYDANIQTINVSTANISNINASTANISTINATTATIQVINSSFIHTDYIGSRISNDKLILLKDDNVKIQSFNISLKSDTYVYIQSPEINMSASRINMSLANVAVKRIDVSDVLYASTIHGINDDLTISNISTYIVASNMHLNGMYTMDINSSFLNIGGNRINLNAPDITIGNDAYNVKIPNLIVTYFNASQINLSGTTGQPGESIICGSNGCFWGLPQLNGNIFNNLNMNDYNINNASIVSCNLYIDTPTAYINTITAKTNGIININSTLITQLISATSIYVPNISSSTINASTINASTINVNSLTNGKGIFTNETGYYSINSFGGVLRIGNDAGSGQGQQIIIGETSKYININGNLIINASNPPAGYVLTSTNTSSVYWNAPSSLWNGNATSDLNMNYNDITRVRRITSDGQIEINSNNVSINIGNLEMTSSGPITMQALNNSSGSIIRMDNGRTTWSANNVSILARALITIQAPEVKFSGPITNWNMGYHPTNGVDKFDALGYVITSNITTGVVASNSTISTLGVTFAGIWLFNWTCNISTTSLTLPLYIQNISAISGFTPIDTNTYISTGSEIVCLTINDFNPMNFQPSSRSLSIITSSTIDILSGYYKAVRLA